MVDHILGHKTSFNKFKQVKFIQSTLPDHTGIELQINNRMALDIFNI
jgi:hypothetical protein